MAQCFYWGPEFARGRVCKGPSLSGAELVRGRDVPESPNEVKKYLEKEKFNDAILGPFDQVPFSEAFCILNTVKIHLLDCILAKSTDKFIKKKVFSKKFLNEKSKLLQLKIASTMSTISFFLSIFTGSLIYEHYTRECEFGNFDKIKNKKHKKTKQHKKTQKLLAEFCLNKECP